MKPRTRRLGWIVLGLATLGIAVALVLRAFENNLMYFYTPSQVANNEVPHDRPFRIGGLVEQGSLKRDSGLDVSFRVTDTARTVMVDYHHPLPDLFKEGKGVVASGTLGPDNVFHASEVLAKHDENYMPPEAALALQRAGKPIEGKLFVGHDPVVTQSAAPPAQTDSPKP
jgi:cytochrome c-type biogenesis protein CcmE